MSSLTLMKYTLAPGVESLEVQVTIQAAFVMFSVYIYGDCNIHYVMSIYSMKYFCTFPE